MHINKLRKYTHGVSVCFFCFCLPIAVTCEAQADTLGSVTFSPNMFLLDNKLGRVRAELIATQEQNSGSASVEIDNPLLYFNPYHHPDPYEDLPCGYGIPGAIAGITESYAFNFGNQAECTTGETGWFGFFYSARVTDNFGTYPSSATFQDMEPLFQYLILVPDPEVAILPPDEDLPIPGESCYPSEENGYYCPPSLTNARVATGILTNSEGAQYQGVSGSSIKQGTRQTSVPEPDMVGALLAVGAWGGVSWHKRKTQSSTAKNTSS
jgi:hypothetical protein